MSKWGHLHAWSTNQILIGSLKLPTSLFSKCTTSQLSSDRCCSSKLDKVKMSLNSNS